MNLFHDIETFYAYQAKVYDVTRFAFLFGRKTLVNEVCRSKPEAKRILELGCGTGFNLKRLAKYYPNADIVGLDASKSMLGVCRQKLSTHANVELIHGKFGATTLPKDHFDIVICSYSLSMFGTDRLSAAKLVKPLIRDHGMVAIVDFYESKSQLFSNYLNLCHVKIGHDLLASFEHQFDRHEIDIVKAPYLFWTYFKFLGYK